MARDTSRRGMVCRKTPESLTGIETNYGCNNCARICRRKTPESLTGIETHNSSLLNR